MIAMVRRTSDEPPDLKCDVMEQGHDKYGPWAKIEVAMIEDMIALIRAHGRVIVSLEGEGRLEHLDIEIYDDYRE